MNAHESFGASHRTEGEVASQAHMRFRYHPSLAPGLQSFADLAVVFVAVLGVSIAMENPVTEQVWFFAIFHAFTCFALCSHGSLYAINIIFRVGRRYEDVLIAHLTSLLLLCSIIFGLSVAENFDFHWLLATAAIAAIACLASRAMITLIMRSMVSMGLLGQSIVVLGAGEQSRRFVRRLRETNPYFAKLVGVFHEADSPPDGLTVEGSPVLGGTEDLLRMVRANKVDDVVVALPWNADETMIRLIERLKELPVNVYLSSDLVGFELSFRPVLGPIRDVPLFEIVQRPISGWSSALKSIEDYTIATVLLIALFPLLVLIAILIKADSRGPVFFKQPRLGFNNKEFHIYKFRTMWHREAPEPVVQQARKGDPRVTPFGRILRATSLDELPQLLNVLNGTMSLVGPRPHALSHNEEYGRRIRGYFARHKVKPGITGLAQIKGFRGETDVISKMEERIRYDVYYADNWSILLDIRIIVSTGFIFMFQKSAY